MFVSFVNAQNLPQIQPLSEFAFTEKIYLQLNNTIFTSNETVWFKAIVTDVFNHPKSLSGVVHVELVDFDKNILISKKLKLEKGIADSFFQLRESYPTGRYLIRAYTNWNRNFGKDFFFERYIDLFSLEDIDKGEVITNIVLTKTQEGEVKLSANINPQVIDETYAKDLKVHIHSKNLLDSVEIKKQKKQYALEYKIPTDAYSVKLKVELEDTKLKNNKLKVNNTHTKTIVIDKNFLDLQFFPEGGKLVDGLKSKLGYKGVKYNGLGTVVNGDIVDEKDNVLFEVLSNELGMGYIFLKPDITKTYYCKVTNADGTIYKYELPKVHKSGYVMSLLETTNYLNLKVETNVKNTDSLFVQIKMRGVLIQEHSFKVEDGFYQVLMQKNAFNEGIHSVVLLNNNHVPLCERLFYNFKESEKLNISVNTNKPRYSQRDKTKLNIVVANTNGQPVKTNLSLLVIDKKQLGDFRKLQPNILSHFLLSSELKGTIENPKYYFNKNSINRKRDMESLMLTQGWSNYVFNKTDTINSFSIKPETDLWISGIVNSVFNKNKPPKKTVDLSLFTFGDPRGFYLQKTDSLGRFAFNLGSQYADTLKFVIQSTNKKGVKKDYNIALDDALAPPKIYYEEQQNFQLADTIVTPYLNTSIENKKVNDGFVTPDNTIELNAVELTGYNLTPKREKVFKLHGPPDVVISNEELEKEEEKWMFGLYSVLRSKFPDDIRIKRVNKSGYDYFKTSQIGSGLDSFDMANAFGADFTFILIDGVLIDLYEYPLVSRLPVEGVKSFEILNHPKNARRYFYQIFPVSEDIAFKTFAIISIYTYSGKGLYGIGRTEGIFKGVISGFSPRKEFYAPKYDVLEPVDWDIADLRSTIHWSPSITTNEQGEAEIEFYNADTTGDMLIILEAISPDGKLGYFESTYQVSKWEK
ncbi:hypothetical protein [Neotamlana nanhaiensis]|nr:hypothetical protein [Tamlana nanhaiensis]